jgi:hypothetical protein
MSEHVDTLERTVRRLLDEHAALAPSELGVDVAALRARPRPHRGRMGAVLAVAALVAALAVAIPVLASRHGTHGVAAATAGGSPRVTPPRPSTSWTSGVNMVVLPDVSYGRGYLAYFVTASPNSSDLSLGYGWAATDGGQFAIDTSAPGDRPGANSGLVAFHGTYDLAGLDGDLHSYLFVGYVSGDAASVQATVNGTARVARLAPALIDGARFWYLPGPLLAHSRPKGSPIPNLSKLVARAADGHVIAVNTSGAAHG